MSLAGLASKMPYGILHALSLPHDMMAGCGRLQGPIGLWSHNMNRSGVPELTY